MSNLLEPLQHATSTKLLERYSEFDLLGCYLGYRRNWNGPPTKPPAHVEAYDQSILVYLVEAYPEKGYLVEACPEKGYLGEARPEGAYAGRAEHIQSIRSYSGNITVFATGTLTVGEISTESGQIQLVAESITRAPSHSCECWENIV